METCVRAHTEFKEASSHGSSSKDGRAASQTQTNPNFAHFLSATVNFGSDGCCYVATLTDFSSTPVGQVPENHTSSGSGERNRASGGPEIKTTFISVTVETQHETILVHTLNERDGMRRECRGTGNSVVWSG